MTKKGKINNADNISTRMIKVNNINICKKGIKNSINSNELRNTSKRKNNNDKIQKRIANILDVKNNNNDNILNNNDSQNKNVTSSKENPSIFSMIKELTNNINNLRSIVDKQNKKIEKFDKFINKQEQINNILLGKKESSNKPLDQHLGFDNKNTDANKKKKDGKYSDEKKC